MNPMGEQEFKIGRVCVFVLFFFIHSSPVLSALCTPEKLDGMDMGHPPATLLQQQQQQQPTTNERYNMQKKKGIPSSILRIFRYILLYRCVFSYRFSSAYFVIPIILVNIRYVFYKKRNQ